MGVTPLRNTSGPLKGALCYVCLLRCLVMVRNIVLRGHVTHALTRQNLS